MNSLRKPKIGAGATGSTRAANLDAFGDGLRERFGGGVRKANNTRTIGADWGGTGRRIQRAIGEKLEEIQRKVFDDVAEEEHQEASLLGRGLAAKRRRFLLDGWGVCYGAAFCDLGDRCVNWLRSIVPMI